MNTIKEKKSSVKIVEHAVKNFYYILGIFLLFNGFYFCNVYAFSLFHFFVAI